METGRKILNLRKDLGVPQKTLAEMTAVTPSALSRIEAGIHQPRGPVALRIARHLGVTADYLLDNDAPYPPPGREILANIGSKNDDEAKTERVLVSSREAAILEAMRKLDHERRVALEAVLAGPREEVRFAAYLLGAGADLPGLEPDELSRFRSRLSE
ncbi:MAG: helix-turn-helix domain-containing protein [Planctomycetota bacterium]